MTNKPHKPASAYAEIQKLSKTSTLYYGDNLEILRKYISDKSIDLIYLDPPFNSNVNYDVIFKTKNSSSQAFVDIWKWGAESEILYFQISKRGDKVADIIDGLYKALGKSNMMAYLTMMTIRLIEMFRVLKSTGSLYLHCDYTSSHYLKIILDAIFGIKHFRNEIIWKRHNSQNNAKQGAKLFGRLHDTIFVYSKTKNYTWNQIYLPYKEDYIKKKYNKIDENGEQYALGDLSGPGGESKGNPYFEFLGKKSYWRYNKEKMRQFYDEGKIIQTTPTAVPALKIYLKNMKGIPLSDIWDDISTDQISRKKFVCYPTQKPIELLKRIISSSTRVGDVVLDPFCGGGTSLISTNQLDRKWVGIDNSSKAIDMVNQRFIEIIRPRTIGP